MARIMESNRQKTFNADRVTRSSVAIFFFILLLYPALSSAGQYLAIRVIDGDTIKVLNDGKESTIRLVGIDASETSKKKNEPGKPFSQKSTKYFAGLVLNKSVDIKSYGTDSYGRTLAVVYEYAKKVNNRAVFA